MKKKSVVLFAIFFSLLMQISTVFAQDKKWYDENRLVAHALGSVGDKKETNSKEAFLNSWGNGFRVMEADFTMTSDGTLVVRHDFDQDSYYMLEQKVNGTTDMNIDRYLNEKINFRYTPLTAAQLIQMMTEYKDVYLITDTKSTDMETIRKQFTAFVNYAKNVEHPEVLDRIIVQIYNPEMYDVVKSIYPFKNWIYTLYQTQNPDYQKIGEYCVANGIDVVTINQEIVDAKNTAVLSQKGIKVFAHTVNRTLDLQKMLNLGCYGIYTDYIKPQDLTFVGLQAMNRKQTATLKFEENEKTVDLYSVLDKKYISLRDMAVLMKDSEEKFSVSFDRSQKTVILQKGGDFIGVGNELVIGQNTKQFIEKNAYSLSSGEKKQETQSFFIDGELYYEPQAVASILGLQVEEKDNVIVFDVIQDKEKK